MKSLSSFAVNVILLVIMIGFSICSVQDAVANDKVGLSDIGSLRAPTSPAFVMLGVEPTAIERPTTPAGIGLAVLNNTDGLASLPKDFAMEFSPYWLTSHPEFNWSVDSTRKPWQSVQRTTAISIATAALGTDESPATGMSLGFRTSILSGKMTDSTIQRLKRMEVLLGNLAGILLNDPTYAALAANDRVDGTNTAQGYMNQLLEANKVEELADFTPEREGFFWEVAGGTLWEIPDDNARKGQNKGWGLWNTLSYRHNKANFLGILRLIDNELISQDNFFDWGARLLVEQKSLSISAEYMKRDFSDDDGRDVQERYIGLIEYRLSPALGINFSFGQDFDADADGSFVSQLGLSLGINPIK